MSLVRNDPTPEGYELGAEIARMTDAQDAKLRAQFPDLRQRCATCAFRKGTMANGCLPTLGDALKCIIEGRGFECHETGNQCAGYQLAVSEGSLSGAEAPWEFSTKDSDADEIAARTPDGPWWKIGGSKT